MNLIEAKFITRDLDGRQKVCLWDHEPQYDGKTYRCTAEGEGHWLSCLDDIEIGIEPGEIRPINISVGDKI